MKKGKTYSYILTFVIFLAIIDVAIAYPFLPTPVPPYENSKWDLTIGDIYWWNVTTFNGTQKVTETNYIFKINNTAQTQYLSYPYYAVQVNPMVYNQTGESFYRDPIYTGTVNLSLIRLSSPRNFYPDDIGLDIIIFIVPKDNAGLMTYKTKSTARDFYDSYFGAYPDAGSSSNSIFFRVRPTNESITFYYDDNGFLTTGEYFTKQDILYPDGKFVEITRILPEIPVTPNPYDNAISFGNYFLMFIVFGVLGLLMYLKRKNKY